MQIDFIIRKIFNKFIRKENEKCAGTNLVIRRRSRNEGDPRRLGIDGDLDERLFFLNEKKMTLMHSEQWKNY